MKKLFSFAFLAACAFLSSGCFSLIDWEHNLNHLKIWNENLDNMHRDIDYYFFDYDWDDPSVDLSFETPNTR